MLQWGKEVDSPQYCFGKTLIVPSQSTGEVTGPSTKLKHTDTHRQGGHCRDGASRSVVTPRLLVVENVLLEGGGMTCKCKKCKVTFSTVAWNVRRQNVKGTQHKGRRHDRTMYGGQGDAAERQNVRIGDESPAESWYGRIADESPADSSTFTRD